MTFWFRIAFTWWLGRGGSRIFLGGGAPVSCSTSTPIKHIVFFSQNTSCIRKPQVISGGGGGAHPLHPPPRDAPAGSFHISLFEGTLHVDKIHVWFKIANITHAPPVPVYRQTDFPPKRVDVSRLHDTVARFRTGVKFSPRYKNRGELTPGWLAPAWRFVVVSCKQIWSHEREPEWTHSRAKVAPVSCKQPLDVWVDQGNWLSSALDSALLATG